MLILMAMQEVERQKRNLMDELELVKEHIDPPTLGHP